MISAKAGWFDAACLLPGLWVAAGAPAADGGILATAPACAFSAPAAGKQKGPLSFIVIGAVPDRLSAGTPLTVRKNGATPAHLDMGWGDSCGTDQNDFAVYEGTLGSWYSHAPLQCSTAGGFSAVNLTPAAGSRYYLIVPLSSGSEGSYGADSAGAEIPAGLSPCRAAKNTTACGSKRVFVSSASYPANFGGHAGADAACQSLANTAALGGTWMAWVSDSASSPAARFIHAPAPYRRIDGTVIAANWTDLTDGTLVNGVALNEYGSSVLAEMWTSTTAAGNFTGTGCNDFTSNSSGAPYAYVGASDKSGYDWTAIYLQFCDRFGLHIYCFEQ